MGRQRHVLAVLEFRIGIPVGDPRRMRAIRPQKKSPDHGKQDVMLPIHVELTRESVGLVCRRRPIFIGEKGALVSGIWLRAAVELTKRATTQGKSWPGSGVEIRKDREAIWLVWPAVWPHRLQGLRFCPGSLCRRRQC